MVDSGDPAPAGSVTRGHSVGWSLLLTAPILVWSLLMFTPVFRLPGAAPKAAGLTVMAFMTALFWLMVKTGETHRWRRIFFVALGFLFPVGFVWELVSLRGSMSIPIERMICGDTPFCFLAIPMMLVPAALTRTVIFPGSILPTATNPYAIAPMVALWLGAALMLGKGWCAYGCFFGGIEEGFAAAPRRARIRDIGRRWRVMPWAVLVTAVLVSAATNESFYCAWLCPFKAVTEYAEVNSLQAAIQAGIFITLFAGLVVVLPLLTTRRTQCSLFCPFGAFQSLFNKINVFEVRIARDKCRDCLVCVRACPALAVNEDSVRAGRTLLSCMKCGACVDSCPRGAVSWHIKGTSLAGSPETARLLFLYPAWGFATMFGGTIIAGSLMKILGFMGRG